MTVARRPLDPRPLDLRPLLEPASVAVVGASANPLKIGGRPIAYMLRHGFAGTLHPVNAGRDEVQGLPCHPSVTAIGRPVDLVVVATPAASVETVVRDGIANGARAFVVFSSGFAELDAAGAEAQRRVAALAREAGAALLGPNCLGAINSANGLAASFTTALEGGKPVPGSFGFISQSGALGAYWLDMVLKLGFGVSKWITTGNEGGVTLADALAHLAEDDETKVIGAYIEDLKDGELFRRAALRAAERGKPVVAIKAGRSAAGAAAAASHTGALAGEDEVYQAFFDQFGICRVRSLGEMLGVAKLMLKQPAPAGRRIGIVSVSGGAGVMLADEASERSLDVPDFSAETKAALAACLPGFGKPQNPLDVTGSVVGDATIFSRVLAALAGSDDHDAYVLFIGLMHSISGDLAAALKTHFSGRRSPVAVVWIGAPQAVADDLEAAGFPVFADIPEAIAAIAARLDTDEAQTRLRAAMRARPDLDRRPATAVAGRTELLSEYRSKVLLGDGAGLQSPRESLVQSPDEVAGAFARLSPPLAVKLQSPDMPHKSEHGGIALHIQDAAAARAAVARMLDIAAARKLRLDGVLLQEMASIDFEFIVALKRDPTFGPMLVVGRGGVEVEVRPDVAMAYLPLSEMEIEAMLRRLASSRLFLGFRGRKAIDVAGLAATLARLGGLFAADPSLVEIEINPLAVTKAGDVLALDVLVTRVQPE